MSEQTHNPTPDQRRNMTGEMLSQAEATEVADFVANILDTAHSGYLAKRERGEPGWQYRSPAAINDAVQDAALRWAMEGRRVPAPEPDVITSAAGPISYAPSADRPCAKCGDDVAGPRHWAGQWVCGGCYARMPAPFTPKRIEEPPLCPHGNRGICYWCRDRVEPQLATGTLAPLERGSLLVSERVASRSAIIHDQAEEVTIAIAEPDDAEALGRWLVAWAERRRGR